MKYKVIDDNKSIYGMLNIKGSTHEENLLREWCMNFKALYPDVNSTMDFQSSEQGIESLINGNANIALTSRKINQKELNIFKEKRGYEPTQIKISIYALAVYVNRKNKIDKLSLPQLDAIFSSSLKRGYKNKIENWKDLKGIDNKINIYLCDKNSSTRKYFQKELMLNGKFNKNNIISDKYTKLEDVINEVALDINGICFGHIGSKNYKVKALALSQKEYFPSYKTNIKNIRTKKYPLIRFSYIYLDIPSDKKISKLLYEFCKYILSKDAQKIISKIGGLMLSPKQIGIELSKIRR